MVNFIKVNSPDAVLQTGSNVSYGYNGVGGVTAEGSIQNWKIDKNLKNLSYSVQFSINTSIGPYDVFMIINADNNATARISGLGPGTLKWDGQIEAPYNSRIFKGQESY